MKKLLILLLMLIGSPVWAGTTVVVVGQALIDPASARGLANAYQGRVELDGGAVISMTAVEAFYQMLLDNGIATSDAVIALSPNFGIKKDGSGNVSKWYNAGGGGASFDAIQATSGSQPVWTANQQNSLPTIIFDGSADFMRAGNPTALNGGGSWFTVACGDSAISNYGLIVTYQTYKQTDNYPYISFGCNGATPQKYRMDTQPSNGSLYSEGLSTVSANTSTYYLIDGLYSAASWTWTTSKINNADMSVANNSPATGTAAMVYIGAGASGTGEAISSYWKGGIGDVYLFNDLGADDHSAVRTFLNTKYAVY